MVVKMQYACSKCGSITAPPDGYAPWCVTCDQPMVPAGTAPPAEVDPLEGQQPAPPANDAPAEDAQQPGEPGPVAPLQVAAYQRGLKEIEDASEKVGAELREWLRAKDYAAKAKKRVEAAEATLREVVEAVAARLRPRPLFEAPDTHTDAELSTLITMAGIDFSPDNVKAADWSDAERQDVRAWALAFHSTQPRIMPPCLSVLLFHDAAGDDDDTPAAATPEAAADPTDDE